MHSSKRSSAAAVLAGFICIGLSATGGFVAFGGAHLVGGIAFIPNPWNDIIGRIVIGIGATVTLTMGIYAFYDAYRLSRK